MKNLLILLLLGSGYLLQAQDEKEIDASKPTNLYTRFNNNLEITTVKGKTTTMGYRANFSYASPTEEHQLTVELPLLYNKGSEKFGIGDMRFRYFWVPYKNYEKKPGAFGLTVDVFTPTGKYENGLGNARWTIAPGVMAGFVFGKWGAFPIISYQYSSKQSTDLISEEQKKALNGVTFQIYNSYVINAKNFIDFTPSFIVNNFEDQGKDDFQIEGNYFYTLKPNKVQIGGFFRRVFNSDITSIRVSLRVFL
jgi:hypothetical protein